MLIRKTVLSSKKQTQYLQLNNRIRTDPIGSVADFTLPPHVMVTHYWYNSLQQLIKQYTPDGDYSTFYYDYLGRLVVSQNAKQAAYTTPAYSYTLYDALGRISEVGEIEPTTAMTSGISRDKDPATVLATNDLAEWIRSGTHSQITNTYYDEALNSTISGYFGTDGQQNLRNRVATITYTAVAGASVYDHATHYSFDIHSNVKTLIQDNTSLETPATAGVAHEFGLKYMDYEYDLISGNVKKVSYQDHPDAQGYPQFDRFYHQYRYDADNRLTQVLTSRDNEIWEKENKYFFYQHGPLARTEIGDKTVQGIDFAYTIQGWVKGINSNTLDNTRDAGHDAQSGSNLNKWFGGDAAAFTLKYFSGDYIAKNNSVNTFEAGTSTNTFLTSAAPSLYNGNISAMATTVMDINPLSGTYGYALPQITGYKYDQLNRLRNAESFTGITSNAWDNTVSGGRYAEVFHYDLNGNINEATRNNSAGNMFDQFTYNYWNKTETTPFTTTIPTDASNKLAFVGDAMPACSLAVDVDDQASGNYHYDEIGNLKSDVKEYITEIKWNAYGKVSEIIKDKTYKIDSCTSTELVLQDLEFKYNASGQRIEKIIKPHKNYANGLGLTDQNNWISTYYIRDAQGNVMATYTRRYEFVTGTTYEDQFVLNELDIYGSSRIGIQRGIEDVDVKNRTFTSSGFTGNMFNTRSYTVPTPPATYVKTYQAYSRTLGYKELEITNHLSSVITTLGDRRISVESIGTPGTLANYSANILSVSDYFSFGMQESERTYTSPAQYSFGFGGQLKDDEIANITGAHYSAEYWEYDSRLGRRWNVDPITYAWQSSYAAFNNNPIYYTDPAGAEGEKNKYDDNGDGVSTSDEGCQSDCKSDVEYADYRIDNPKNATGAAPTAYKVQADATVRLNYYKPKVNELVKLQQAGKISDATYSMSRYQAQKATKMQLSNTGQALSEVEPFGKPLQQQKSLAESVASGEKSLPPNALKTRTITTKIATAGQIGGRVIFVASAGMSIHHVVTADNTGLAITQEAAGWGGAVAGAEGLGSAGLLLHPVAGVVGAIGGGIIGYFFGYEAGTSMYQEADLNMKGDGTGIGNKNSSLCFVAGTKILMANGNQINIEDVKVGDKIKSVNISSFAVEKDIVLDIDSPIHRDLIKIIFSDGTTNLNTFDHPYYVKNKGWCSYKPGYTKSRYHLDVLQLEDGDICLKYNEGKLVEITISSIKEDASEDRKTYNLTRVANNSNFFANNILVHNKFNPVEKGLTIPFSKQVKKSRNQKKVNVVKSVLESR